MTINKKISGWLVEAAENFRIISECIPEKAPMRAVVEKYRQIILERSALVENIRCETCRWWWEATSYSIPTTSHCLSTENNVGNPRGDRSKISYCGPGFYCCHWEGRGRAFTCENCGESFLSQRSIADREKEQIDNGFGSIDANEMAIVCDNCYVRLMEKHLRSKGGE
jgi:hypothetical protein